MITVYGFDKQTAQVLSNNRDDSAIKYLQELMLTEPYKGQTIKIMPDYHKSSGGLVGTVMTLGDKVSAYSVGQDLGCGIIAYPLEGKINFKMLDKFIHTNIAIRDNSKDPYNVTFPRQAVEMKPDFEALAKKIGMRNETWEIQLGSLGAGNHYLEICQSNIDCKYWLVIHSGSRGFGGKVAEYYQVRTSGHYKDPEGNRVIGKGYLDGDLATNYYSDAEVAYTYAKINRRVLVRSVLDFLKIKFKEENVIESIHNLIKDGILRKGAISGKVGETAIIALNMRDGNLLVKGKGNDEWLQSLPHGAGRLMSRADCKNILSMKDYKDSMAGIFTTSISKATIDESPMAYKDSSHIIDSIKDNAEILERWKTVYSFKGTE
jgi:RNA-splicing ligase RtcB